MGIKCEDLINDEPSNPILQLVIRVFPSLQLLSVGPRADPRPDLQIAFISWRRNKEADAEFPFKFAPETVDCMVQSASFRPTEQDRRILSKTRHLRLCCDQECSNTTNGIWAILENATTISTLVLCAHKTETATNALAALQRVSGSIEEMQLILPSWNDKGRWVVWDQAVYEVLSTKPRRYPNLHSLKMVFPTSSTSLEGEEEEDTIYVDLTNRLPSTRDWCATHRIQFGSLRDDRKPACFSLLYRRN